MGASGLLLHWELWLCAYSCVFFFFLFLLTLPSETPKLPQTHQWEGFLVFWNFSPFTTPSPRWVSIPNSFVSLFVFMFCPTSFQREWAPSLGAQCPLSGFRSLFCGSCSTFKWSFDEFEVEKVVSPSYSSAILGLPPSIKIFLHSIRT